MIGSPKHDEPLTDGEAFASWRMRLRFRWSEDAVVREEVGDRVYLHWALEEIHHIAA